MTILIKNRAIATLKLMATILTFSTSAIAFDNLNINKETSDNLAFVGGNVLNPSVEASMTHATILVSQGNIVRIQPSNQSIPNNYTIVDIQDKWVVPGLIDGHIHLAQSGSAFTRPDTIDATQIYSYEKDQQWLLDNTESILKSYLKLGITTVYDMGGPSEYLNHYRNVTAGDIYPDIFASGTILSPMAIPSLNANGKTFTQVTSSKQAIDIINKQLINNTDILKIVWSQETGLSTQALFDLYQPAIELAKAHNKTIAVHVEELINAKAAIKAGADILVHSVMTEPVDKEFITLMKQHNVTYMPTLTAYSHYFELFKRELTFTQYELEQSNPIITNSFKVLQESGNNTDQMLQIFWKYMPKVDEPAENIAKLTAKEQSIVKQLQAFFSTRYEDIQKVNLKQILDAGINVALGTDAGNPGTLHAASLFGEAKAWNEAGISNEQILKAITYGNAVALGLDNNLGNLLPGMYANFVVLKQNPYKTLDTLKKPIMTVKRGNIIKLGQSEKHEK